MKIGIITYHSVPNFGAQLQAISSVGYLKKMGHEVVMLHWYAADLEEMYSHRIPYEQIVCHEDFTAASLPVTRKLQQIEDLVEEIETQGIDAIVVGSDALFKYFPLKNRRRFLFKRLKYRYDYYPLSCELLDNNPFFGEFIGALKRKIPVSVYAASSQNCPYQRLLRTERKKMANALSYYRKISVRDVWTKNMIESITKRKNIQVYPDPVFSFNSNCYIKIPSKEEIFEKYGLTENYVLLSFSGKFLQSEGIAKIAKELESRGYMPVALPMPEKLVSAGIENCIQLPLSPIEWYALIIHSRGYIGERMHPIVVCLHNAVPFFCFDEYGTNVKKHFYSRSLVYSPSSSKTYQIVEDAGFLENLYSYKAGAAIPSAEFVVDKLQTFNIEKCREFSKKKERMYNAGMSDILDSLNP